MDILIIPKKEYNVNVMKNKKVFFTTKWITYTAMLTALVVATGYVPAIPVLTGKIYWCDFVIYMAAYLTDPIASFIVGGVGTSFFDLFGINGTAYNAIPSLFIHGVQGLTASTLFLLWRKFAPFKKGTKAEVVGAVLSSILPALIVIFGYFLKRITWEHLAVEVALGKMPANILQEIIGVTVALIILYATSFKRQLERSHLLPDFTEILKKPAAASEEEPQEITAKQTQEKIKSGDE